MFHLKKIKKEPQITKGEQFNVNITIRFFSCLKTETKNNFYGFKA